MTEESRGAEKDKFGATERLTAGTHMVSNPGRLEIKDWDRFRIDALIGQGGMARVYRAFDLKLKRYVALKFLQSNDPNLRKRLLKEAQAQAQIQHENVCEIFEVGEVQGMDYIAMQLIEGETLHVAAKEMTLQQKILVMHHVALGVHAAHRLGIIHRDIKPANVMVQEVSPGMWRPYVMDFGLAREISPEEPTLTSSFFGTPSFMAPEQALIGQKGQLDRRSDVYSLGASLYYILSGRRPYEGTEMEVLVKLTQEESPPLRKAAPDIPRDLDTIVNKCLEKDPNRRYDSAKALAEDLRRYIDGEPISARPSGKINRLQRKIRKHKWVAGIVGVSILLAVLFGGAGLYTWRQSGKRLEVLREFVQAAETIEWRIRVAYSAPLHDVTSELKQVGEQIKALEMRMAQLGNIAKGAGNFALGRAYLLLSEFEKSRLHLEQAWQSGYTTSEAAYALGITFGKIYQRELAALQRINSPAEREKKRTAIEADFRNKALEFLRRSRGGRLELPEYLEGLIAFYEKQYSEALAKARLARRKAPWFHDALRLEADIHMALGLQEWENGRNDAARRHYDAAGDAYRKAIEIARSDASLYESECWRWLQILEVEAASGEPVKQPMENALQVCDSALKANPASAVAYSRKSRIWWRWGEEQMYRGEDITKELQETVAAAENAIRLQPRDVYALFELGNALALQAEFRQFSGRDPSEFHRRAVSNYEKAIAIDASLAAIHNNLGVAWVNFSRHQISRGEDPRASMQAAIDACKKAIERNQNFLPAWNTLGNAYITKAKYETLSGLDPLKSLNLTIESYQNALKAHPDHPVPLYNLSTVFVDRAKVEATTGRDPNESLKLAKLYADKTIAISKDAFPMAHNNIGQSFLWEAKNKIRIGEEPGNLFSQSIENSEKAIRSGSNEAHLGYNNILETLLTESEYLMQRSIDPTRLLNRARLEFEKAVKGQPDSDTFHHRARVELLAAQWNFKNQKSPESQLNTASSFLSKALELNPQNALVHWTYAERALCAAKWRNVRNHEAGNILKEGITHAQKALALNPRFSEASATLASLNQLAAKLN